MSTSSTSTGSSGTSTGATDRSVDVPVVVGRIGRPHGIRGDVTIDVRTDVPERRFTAGTKLDCEPTTGASLAVVGSRWHSGRLLVRFEGIDDRNAAEALRGRVLTIPAAHVGAAADDADDEDAGDLWWDRDLIALRAVTVDGVDVGVVVDVVHTPAGELLAIGLEGDREVLVPFVREIVPTVDVARGRIMVDPPPGLFDLE